MHADTVEAGNWWARPRGAENTAWVTNYQNSLATRHRAVIASIVSSIPGVTSVLEMGSHCGPNLIRIAQTCPAVEQLTGFDVNAEAVAAGTRWSQSLGLGERIQLVQGRVPEATLSLPDGCVDVVLSCYALAYIAPADLDAVLYEAGRLARRAIVLAEPMSDATGRPDGRMTLGGYREWAHNYRGASKWIGTWRGSALSLHRVDPPVDALASILVAMKPSSP